MSETVANAVAQRDNSPGALIKQYSTSFANVLPTHVKPDTWVRLAQGALKKGRRFENNPAAPFELEVAAANNPGVFLAALLDAARQGLEPGTEQYYLTPRKNRGKLEILGIVGYQGYIELMYRSGAVSSVVVEVVRENDEYEFIPGRVDDRSRPRWIGAQEIPYHAKPGGSFAREADRGKLIGVYAYARLTTGAVSKVIELTQDDIDRIKAVNPFSDGTNSPWVKWEKEMWLKSGARQLRKWVPTSAEYRQELARAAGEAQRVASTPDAPVGIDQAQGDVLEGEVLDDAPADTWPEPATVPGGEA
jgi:recombination protein RecT